MTHSQLRFGLIGTGRIGQVHAANIATNGDAELAWICDPDVHAAQAVANRFGGRVTGRIDDFLRSDQVDALVVASPTPTHIDLIAAALAAGVPVFCEKPIDLDIKRVDDLRPAVAAAPVPVALGFNRRFDPSFAEARRRVHDGEIGDIEQLTIISRDPEAPPAEYTAVSGGLFRDMSIHDLDLARYFVGDIAEVHAMGDALFDDGAQRHRDLDSAVITLRAESGALVTIINSRHSAVGYDQRLEAFGASGTIAVGNAPTNLVRASGRQGVETGAPYQDFFITRYAEAYRNELAEFVRLARGEDSSCPTFEDGREALLLADAAQASVQEKRPQRLVRT